MEWLFKNLFTLMLPHGIFVKYFEPVNQLERHSTN